MEFHRQTVLIVDDEPGNVSILVQALADEQEIVVATNGLEALDIAAGQNPDLILLDVLMPGLNGYEVCTRLKADPLTRQIPVIFLSEMGNDEEETRGLDLGAIDYLTKPIRPRIVKARVHNHLELKRYRDLLENMSSTDGLTGIANRRMLDEVLAREWRRGLRQLEPIGLVMMDIDNFRAYNDHYSHLSGDDCLRKVAHVLVDCARRGTDLTARFGGEEFACLLPSTDLAGAMRVANRIQSSINQLSIPHAYSPVARVVTLSYGVAVMVPESGKEWIELVKLADELLYEAKHCGKNQIKALCISSREGLVKRQAL
jgi:diguanylate cyclase (GGDEF)-like protein